MSVKIRLKRLGSKKRPFYRIVVADSRNARNGRFIEELGYYNPLTEPKEVKVDAEKANYWIGVGAKPTDTVNRLFKNNGVYGEKAAEAKKEEASAKEEAPVEEVKAEETVEETPAEAAEETVEENTEESAEEVSAE